MDVNLNKLTYLDGGMGTMLQAAGLPTGENPETYNITHPEIVRGIHSAYFAAGSNIVYANTFGANRHKLARTGYSVEQVITAGVGLAKQAASSCDGLVALDLGPIGELLEPMGTLSFEEAYALFAQQVEAGVKAGADLIAIETMTDLYEAKAAVLAAKEHSALPVICTMTFERDFRTFTGCGVSNMALTMEGLGVDALGVNCSLGPFELYDIVKELKRWTSLPLIVKPNAGLPVIQEGKTVYNMGPERFAQGMERFLELGVTVLGGCCGTTPDYIRALVAQTSGKSPAKREDVPPAAVCSYAKTVEIDRVRVIGERINPTGKKRFQQALIDGDMDYILHQAMEQADAGADLLDVNVGLPQIDEKTRMVEVVREIQGLLDLPLQLDSSDSTALEAGLRAYNGKAIVNSVNGEEAVLDRILPIVKKYGAAVVGLTLDQNGIPKTAGERLEIARRILQRAERYGIPARDVYIDCLTLTVSAEQDSARETLEAIRLVKKELGLKTVLGVSNISFGLPNRERMNQTFLALAMSAGLDLPIINPNVASMMDTVAAFHVLSGADKGSADYVERFADWKPAAPSPAVKSVEKPASSSSGTGAHDIFYTVSKGLGEEAKSLCGQLLEQFTELEVINDKLIPALDQVGKNYETGKIFLPQLIASAEAAKAAFAVVNESLSKKQLDGQKKEPIVLATVKGDIHDIGKNIVKVVLENYGYPIIDLGRDVPIEKVVEAVLAHKVRLVGLSALMTTTLKNMELTIKALRESGADCKIWVGGAVLTPEYAKEIGADFYAKDAQQSVQIAREVLG